jgi:endonuclease YncB( thermonuclease family)
MAWQSYDMLKLCTVFFVLLTTLTVGEVASAHGGGLDASGCHHDRKRGGYHCHRGNSSPAPVYRAPVRQAPETVKIPESTPVPIPLYSSGAAPAIAPSSSRLMAPIEGQAQVLDGDTIQIGTTRIRLYGVDAFEAEQMCKSSDGETYGCGGRATRTLTERVSGHIVSCVPKGNDAFARQLAVCRVTSTDLSSWMARQGHALAYTKYALDYVIDERAAKQERAGAWEGSFELPWEFRISRPSGAAEAQRAPIAPSAKCNIKGNVNKEGERIYHLPSDPFYYRVKPENWFCSNQEAESAGFRRAGMP